MALVIEDGTGKPDANSYGSVAGARSYAGDRGVTLSVDDAVVSGQLVNATDYLESFAYVGKPKTVTQALSWPRSSVVYFDGSAFPDTSIPVKLVNAQYQAVIDQTSGIELEPSIDISSGFVTEDKVDVLLTKFSENVGTSRQPFLPKVYALLVGLLASTPIIKVVRV